MAIFYSILEEPVAPSIHIYSQVWCLKVMIFIALLGYSWWKCWGCREPVCVNRRYEVMLGIHGLCEQLIYRDYLNDIHDIFISWSSKLLYLTIVISIEHPLGWDVCESVDHSLLCNLSCVYNIPSLHLHGCWLFGLSVSPSSHVWVYHVTAVHTAPSLPYNNILSIMWYSSKLLYLSLIVWPL